MRASAHWMRGSERGDQKMSSTEVTPSWLNEKDRGEWEWAANYLFSRTSFSERGGLGLNISNDFNVLVRTIHNLESTVDGVKLVARLRNAIRQQRYRSSKGGRATCSFTLPRQTKAALKNLAKSHGTSETALIQHMIENATALTKEQKETKHRQDLEAKVTRNTIKLGQELLQIRIEETRKQLSHCLKQVALWEASMGGELPGPTPEEEAKAVTVTEKRMRVIQEAIDASVARHELLSPRSDKAIPGLA